MIYVNLYPVIILPRWSLFALWFWCMTLRLWPQRPFFVAQTWDAHCGIIENMLTKILFFFRYTYYTWFSNATSGPCKTHWKIAKWLPRLYLKLDIFLVFALTGTSICRKIGNHLYVAIIFLPKGRRWCR